MPDKKTRDVVAGVSDEAGAKLDRFMIDGDDARQFGLKCIGCGSPKTIYFISFALTAFPVGAYCYDCLLKRCLASRMIPYPIDEQILNRLKIAMGVGITAVPKHYIKSEPNKGGF